MTAPAQSSQVVRVGYSYIYNQPKDLLSNSLPLSAIFAGKLSAIIWWLFSNSLSN
jgi:hypothetical protein